MPNSPIIDATELINLDPKSIILADIRTGPNARESYANSHLHGAIFFDLEKDLAAKKDNPADGGRHPLPDPESFCKMLGKAGIGNDSAIIAYDDKNGANAAARFWWMMKAAGHKNIRVINGGLQSAIDAGFPLSGEVSLLPITEYVCAGKWQLPIIDINTAAQYSADPRKMLIDVREVKRYNGETEPIDSIAGHIPGAHNYPFANNLDENGKFLQPGIIKENYLKFIGNKSVDDLGIHCGSGVTACHTILALDYAGLGIPALYVGSWSEWSRSGREMVTKDTQ